MCEWKLQNAPGIFEITQYQIQNMILVNLSMFQTNIGLCCKKYGKCNDIWAI